MSDKAENAEFVRNLDLFRDDYGKIVASIARVIVGQQQPIDQILTCLLSGGHALIEGVPGLGKTLLVKTLAEVLDLEFSRIQFTPDLMPADITGTNIVVATPSGGKEFQFHRGPIFANLILADEINRATPKTQSAMLEAMGTQTVSAARTTHNLPNPFFVLATQNPLEMEGTYPLPEAQIDRFMFKINIEYPQPNELVKIMERTTGTDQPQAEKVADGPRIDRMRTFVRSIPISSHVSEYIAKLVTATSPTSPDAPDVVKKYVLYGSSPRGAQAIVLGAKVLAIQNNRANVSIEDINTIAPPALRHRLILSFEAQSDGINPDEIIREISG